MKLNVIKCTSFFFTIFSVTIFSCYSAFCNTITSDDLINITGGDSLGEVRDIYMVSKNEVELITVKNGQTLLYSFDLEKNTLKNLCSIGYQYTYSCISGDNIYMVVLPEAYVYRYEISSGKNHVTDYFPQSSNGREQFCGDMNGKLYGLNLSNPYEIIVHSQYGENKSLKTEKDTRNISSDPSGENIYCTNYNGTHFTRYNVEKQEFFSYSCSGKFPKGAVRFLNPSIIIDRHNGVFRIDDSNTKVEFLFDNTKILFDDSTCLVSDKIISYDESKIYKLDSSSGLLEGDICIKCKNIILSSLGDNFIMFSKSENGYGYKIICLDDFSGIDKKIITCDEGSFTFSPLSGKYDKVDLSNGYCWTLSLDKNKFYIANTNNLTATIVENKTGEKHEITLGDKLSTDGTVINIFPDFITYDEEYYYSIELDGICDTDGCPCIAKHSVNLYYLWELPYEYSISSHIYNFDYDTMTVTGIEPSTTVSGFKSNISVNGYNFVINDLSGNIIYSGKIGTGKTISFIIENKLIHKFTFIIYGDLTGNGNINRTDLNLLKNYLLDKNKITGPFLLAADINHDEGVDTSDLLLLSKHILGKYKIVQK